MADKGRDLKVSILSDADRFDLTAPARDLDELGTNARDAGDGLDELSSTAGTTAGDLNRIAREAHGAGDDLVDMGRDAKDGASDVERAGRDAADQVDKLGTSAKETADKVDGAFRDIAQASKAGARDVERAGDDGKESLREMGEEGTGTAREMAASFDGSADGIKDAFQEAATNVLATLGPLGAAAGVAAGLAIGFISNASSAASEKVKELSSALLDLKLDGLQDVASKVRQVLDTLKDADELNRFRDAARKAGIDWTEYVEALAEGGDKAEAMQRKLQPLYEGLGGAAAVMTDTGRAANDLYQRLREQTDAQASATDAANAYTEALPATTEAVEALADALDGFTDPAGVYTDTLAELEEAERERAQTVADKTKDATDSWEDHVKDVDVSTDQYLDALQRQVEAQEHWADNLGTLAKRGVDAGVLEQLARMGPEGAPLVAKLTKASDAELDRMNALFRRKGATATDNVAASIVAGEGKVGTAAGALLTTAQGVMDAGLTLETRLIPPPGANVRQMRRDVQNNLAPVVLPVMLQNVPAGTWSRYRP